MLSKIEIEKYKMLISAMPEDKAIEATEMLKEAMKDGAETSKTLPKINKFVMQNANVYIVKDENEIEGKDLTKYDLVMFDCDVKDVTDFSNCPKKMIFNGFIDWRRRDFEKLPDISESIVYGSFDCHWCENLTSLEGAPKKVGGKFDCHYCENLTSLEGAPKEVGGGFYCSSCGILESLEGAPEKVGGSFNCRHCVNLEESGIYLVQDGQYYDVFNLPKDKEFVINGDLDLSCYSFEQLPDLTNVVVKGDFTCHWCENLTSLEGAPKKVGGKFDCHYCENLTSLEGAPKEVGGGFNCRDCDHLTSLVGAPKEVGGYFNCEICKSLTSLVGAPEKVGGYFCCKGCPNLISLEGAPKEVGGDFVFWGCKGLRSIEELPMHIGRKIRCDDKFRPVIDIMLEIRKQQANQSTLPPNGFGNSGR